MGKNNKRKTTEEFKNEVKELVGSEFSIISEYINVKTHVKFIHNSCGNIFYMSPDHFLRGYRCPKCSYKRLGSSRKIKNEDVKKFIESVDGYTLQSEYISSNSKITIKHEKCGNIFDMKFRYFKDGQRCPKCRKSKGEEKIENWLISKNYDFISQFRFNDCRDIRPLPFDFKVNLNGLFILIEYDGEQHFGESRMFEGNPEHDEIKNRYCIDNSIPLLRISYKDFNNVEKILENYLSSTTIPAGSRIE